jgi:DNA-binding NarL/FixJ family response regulator
VIVDDHPLFRNGLRQVIVDDARFELVGEADSGASALTTIAQLKPDLAVLDIHLPDTNGLEVAALLSKQGSTTRIVALTMLKDEAAFNSAMNLGIQGFVLKESAVSEIVSCLLSVSNGDPYISPALSAFLLKRRDRTAALAARTPSLDDLTVAERRILKRIADKKSSKEIAQELDISPRTVDTHRANIGGKLGLKGNNSILQFALENRDALAHLE